MELLTFEDITSLCEKQYNSHILDSFSKKKSYYLRLLYESEGNGINYITSLRSKNFISDYDIYRLAYSKINDFSSDYSENNLLDIISTQKNDGTLYLSDSNQIHNLCYDAYSEFINKILSVGGKIDHDEFLSTMFSGEKEEYLLFNKLIDRFKFSSQSLSESASWILYNEYYSEENGKLALEKIMNQGIDINYLFDEDFELCDYDSFLGLLFSEQPLLLINALKSKPNKEVINNFPWGFIISESRMQSDHVSAIIALKNSGYTIPIDEIIEHLDEKGEASLSNLIKSNI
ncbi:hypothetical protein F0266_08465 [Vibrio coralliilyticus]|uniref:hypothetical protein n=1 Tax=Vibrio coralliilyticus TaxID=190893 RepID=UPI00148E19E1|nr:hypothetical protein [Vibrio coralliilyticus]NOH52964.1 hypothetical protein [Vibrio coralliilyticus]